MEDLLEILREINPDVDYETCDRLVEDGHITSMQIVMLVGEINQVHWKLNPTLTYRLFPGGTFLSEGT